MLPFFWYMLKVIVCSGILFAYYWLFLRNKIFHGYNRFYLLVSVLLSLILPLIKINFWQPDSQQYDAMRVLQAVSTGDEYINNIVAPAQRNNWNTDQLYATIYWLITLFFLLTLIRTLLLIRKLLRRYPVQRIEEIAFINTQHSSTPFSFLHYIFWNSNIDINTSTGRQIFKHEVAHIQQKHTYDKLLLNAVLIFCWCNPFFWFYRKELSMIHEFIADKKAVKNSDAAAFAAMILQAAYPKHQFELVNNFFYSPIKRRMLMLSKNKNPKVNYMTRIMVLPLMVLVFAAFSLKLKNETKRLANEIQMPAKSEAPVNIEIPVVHSSIADTVPARIVTGVNPDAAGPLYIVNGKETDKTVALSMRAADIQDMRVIKDAATLKLYGEKGKNGVVIINTKPGVNVVDSWTAGSFTLHGTDINQVLGKKPLLVVDNIVYPGKTLSEIAGINRVKRFENIDVYAPEEAMRTYGESAKDGAIIAYTLKQKEALTEVRAENDLPKADSIYISALKLKLQKEQELSAKAAYEQNTVTNMKLNEQEMINQKGALEKLGREKAKLEEVKVVLEQKMNEQELRERKLQLEKIKHEQQLASFNNTGTALKKLDIVEVQAKPIKPVFTKVEQNPQFTGGSEAWKKFLQANLKANIPAEHGAKAGVYKVILSFIVQEDGSLSDIKCEQDPGFGTCAEAIRLIKLAPRWQPAIQNGKRVNSYFKQPITFVVE